MFGVPNPKKIEEMMKKLNLDVREITANKVLIEADAKQIIIENPKIMIAKVMGRDVYQISGDIYERIHANEEDIRLVMEKTGKGKKTVTQKLQDLNYDLAQAIRELNETKRRKKKARRKK